MTKQEVNLIAECIKTKISRLQQKRRWALKSYPENSKFPILEEKIEKLEILLYRFENGNESM